MEPPGMELSAALQEEVYSLRLELDRSRTQLELLRDMLATEEKEQKLLKGRLALANGCLVKAIRCLVEGLEGGP